MKIDDLKDLKKLIQLCQSQGVKAIEIDNIKLELDNYMPTKRNTTSTKKQVSIDPTNFTPNVDETIQIPQMLIPTDELSPEDLLFYSSENTN